jgi:hypothetical protein
LKRLLILRYCSRVDSIIFVQLKHCFKAVVKRLSIFFLISQDSLEDSVYRPRLVHAGGSCTAADHVAFVFRSCYGSRTPDEAEMADFCRKFEATCCNPEPEPEPISPR